VLDHFSKGGAILLGLTAMPAVACGKGVFTKEEFLEMVKVVFASILFGIVLLLVVGGKDFRLIALLFTLVWKIYAIGLGIWRPSWYIFSPDEKFLPGLPNSHPLIQGQLFYGQSTSPYKLSRLNCEYRYLRLLLSRCIYPNYIFACVCQEIKSKAGKPD
jgi:hypothetical protein